MLRSNDVRVRRAAFTLLEASNPRLRRDSALFIEIVQFIWNANPSYDVYREFSGRHLFVRPYKVHELIIARLKQEKLKQESAATGQQPADKRGCKRGIPGATRSRMAVKPHLPSICSLDARMNVMALPSTQI
jgi:hypothetical protein